MKIIFESLLCLLLRLVYSFTWFWSTNRWRGHRRRWQRWQAKPGSTWNPPGWSISGNPDFRGFPGRKPGSILSTIYCYRMSCTSSFEWKILSKVEYYILLINMESYSTPKGKWDIAERKEEHQVEVEVTSFDMPSNDSLTMDCKCFITILVKIIKL